MTYTEQVREVLMKLCYSEGAHFKIDNSVKDIVDLTASRRLTVEEIKEAIIKSDMWDVFSGSSRDYKKADEQVMALASSIHEAQEKKERGE